MAEFARNLEQAGFFDHPIVDATGLEAIVVNHVAEKPIE